MEINKISTNKINNKYITTQKQKLITTKSEYFNNEKK